VRYIVFGAGAIGGTIGGRLAAAGREVALVARGAHLGALRRDGLRLMTPDGEERPAVGVAGTIAEAGPGPDDVVILAMKSQGTASALVDLAAVADPGVAVVCAQNGVENERLALRRFARTYGMCVVLPASHLEPGVVAQHAAPVAGVLDIGCFPGGSDVTAERVAADLASAGFDARAVTDVMRWKYCKLLANLGNAIDAAAGFEARRSDLFTRARQEGEACLRAAGIAWVPEEQERERRSALSRRRPAGGIEHKGSSSWQSLARGTGDIEADWLNGEVVLLGRLHGVPTPVNEALCRLANHLAAEGIRPGSMAVEEIEAEVR
jgi:2-dehydropantoate 2-reductase